MDDKERKMCRNPRCGCRMPAPVVNVREAFCTTGCYRQFYRTRCLMCERAFSRTNEQVRFLCGRRKCQNDYDWHKRNNPAALGRFWGKLHGVGSGAVETPVFAGSGTAPAAGRPWHVIAGGPVTPAQLHWATLEGSAMEQIRDAERKSLEALRAAGFALPLRDPLEQATIAANGEFQDTEWTEVVSPDGVRCFIR